jgi:uncharacterized protein YegL
VSPAIYHYKNIYEEAPTTIIDASESPEEFVELCPEYGKDNYLMISHQIPDEQKEGCSKNYNFILDRSGSMAGSKIKQALDALVKFVQSLPQNSFFNVVSFGNSYEGLWKNSVLYNDDNVKTCLDTIMTYSADMGGTEIYKCLEDLLKGKLTNYKYDAESPTKDMTSAEKIFVLLTDGQVSNVDAITTLLQKYKNKCRVFAIGIGNDADRNLIENMATVTHGTFKMVIDETNLTDTVIDMLDYTTKQYYTNVQCYINSTVVDILPSLYPNEYFSSFVKLTDDEYETLKTSGITIVAKNPLNNSLKEWKFKLDKVYESTSMIAQYYAHRSITKLNKEYTSYLLTNPERLKAIMCEILNLSLKYHVISDYTSFIIVDHSEKLTDKDELVTVHVPHHAANVDFEVFRNASMMRYMDSRCDSMACRDTMAPPVSNDVVQFGGTKKKSAPQKFFKSKTRSHVLNYDDGDSGGECELSKSKMRFGLTSLKEKILNYVSKKSHDKNIIDTATNTTDKLKQLMDFKSADGSFKYTSDSYKYLNTNMFTSQKQFEQSATLYNMTPAVYFNFMVLIMLKQSGSISYKLIARNLTLWIQKNYELVGKSVDDILKDLSTVKSAGAPLVAFSSA